MRSVLTAVLVIPVTIICALLAMLSCLTFTKAAPTFFMQLWGKALMVIAGVELELKGTENMEPGKPAVVMANHASMIDIPVLIAALPLHLRFVFKQSILFVPFLGWAIYAMGMIPIDRGNRKRASESLRKAAQRIRGGYDVLIFPEGTRSKNGQLIPFKKGGFYLALEHQLDILPITIRNSRELCGRNSMLVRPGKIEIVIHPRFSTSDYTLDDRSEVLEKVKEIIASKLPAKTY